jgi:hypothetical protein
LSFYLSVVCWSGEQQQRKKTDVASFLLHYSMKIYKIRYIFLIVSTLSIISCVNNHNKILESIKHSNIDSATTDSIVYGKIQSVPEVKNLEKEAIKENIMMMISERPDSDFKYYWVQVGINDTIRFRPVFNFYVAPNNFNILYLTDSLMTLTEWRKSK